MKIVESNEFKKEIESGVTVVDFFATWCGPCKMLAPVLEQLATEMEGKAKFIKVDIDQSSDLANEFKILSVPTMMIFKNGEKIDQLVGFLPKEKIQEVITNNL
ncbi:MULTISPECIES: thioredoxin [Clostridium]|uniref:Thioredoxin n=1 Tax=Clostridium saccharoperbutylacetonicum N1-4(HMT) TaxID=931276 RepID=M1MLZ3_9CLOT|nr:MULTISPECIES: thioredoxin [Clostridium]AGF58959.1 thioredoxin TrxA [Clostridium saccharoperbutylacetonicum N1-4(HMT)]AQR97632.1 thioredoxin [Clostridium saccharoperbutylacetonicum]NRT60255.1 thioredoxin 1 [Clostridium saccharoperbutylacetonicum]NSB23567.1 thioredoxin 1 [Clostridium saccharoperbutylacetonicum]NSB33517.1 thioredoxin 1 [Clostridium saccharoperbutylacetonicum]